MIEITDRNFNTEVLEAAQPVLVVFVASWCGPSKSFKPHIEHHVKSTQYQGIKSCIIDIDQSPNAVETSDVRSTPTSVIFNKGKIKGAIMGGQSSNLKLIDNAVDRVLWENRE